MSRHPSEPQIAVAGVAVAGGRVLLGKRALDPGAGEWSVPGGRVELGESLADALEREMREECGLAVTVGPALMVAERIERDEEGEVLYHYVIIDHVIEHFTGEARAGSDCSELAWMTPEEAKSAGVGSAIRALMRQAISATGG